MDKVSIMRDIWLDEIRLTEISAKIMKRPKKPSVEVNLSWEYKINNNDEKNLEITALARTVLEGMFLVKANYIINFRLKRPITEEEINNEIDNILYYAGVKNTLLSSILTDAMFGIPIPAAPIINKNSIKLKSD